MTFLVLSFKTFYLSLIACNPSVIDFAKQMKISGSLFVTFKVEHFYYLLKVKPCSLRRTAYTNHTEFSILGQCSHQVKNYTFLRIAIVHQ